MESQISIQQVWTAPNGKVRVITTPEQTKYHCYKLPLFQYIQSAGQSPIIVWKQTIRQRDNQEIKEIINVKNEDGDLVLKETAEPKGEQDTTAKETFRARTSYRDEDRTDARTAAMEIGQNYRAGLIKEGSPFISIYKAWLTQAMACGGIKIPKEKE